MAPTDEAEKEELPVFAVNLVAFREELQMTQQALAEEAGLSAASIHRYERGKGLPERDSMMRLAKIFGRRMDDLFNTTPPPRQEEEFAVAFKISGKAPPGLERALRQTVRDWKPDTDLANKVAASKREAAKKRKPLPPPAPSSPKKKR